MVAAPIVAPDEARKWRRCMISFMSGRSGRVNSLQRLSPHGPVKLGAWIGRPARTASDA